MRVEDSLAGVHKIANRCRSPNGDGHTNQVMGRSGSRGKVGQRNGNIRHSPLEQTGHTVVAPVLKNLLKFAACWKSRIYRCLQRQKFSTLTPTEIANG